MSAGTFINENGATNPTGTSISIILSGVQEGDLIIVGSGTVYFFHTSTEFSCNDNIGSDYGQAFYTHVGHNGIVMFKTVLQSTPPLGILTITVDDPTYDVSTWSVSRLGIVANWRDAAKFDQSAFCFGTYIPSDSPTYQIGVPTAPFNVADCLAISLAACDAGSITSDTGDTLVRTQGNFLRMFYRLQEGPAGILGQVKIKNSDVNGSSIPLISLIFNKPLPRPEGEIQQNIVRPGSGEGQYNPAANATSGETNFPETNRPLIGSLYYPVKINSLIFVGICQSNGTPDLTEIEDDLGNVYTYHGISPGFGGITKIQLFTTILKFIPAEDEVFRIRLFESPSNNDVYYQCTGIGISEYILANPNGYQFVPWDHNTVTSEITLYTEERSVSSGALLLLFAAWKPSVGQPQVNWSEVDGFIIRRKWELTQYPFAITNDPRLLSCAIMDKISNGGNEIGKILVSMDTDGGSIAMLIIEFGGWKVYEV